MLKVHCKSLILHIFKPPPHRFSARRRDPFRRKLPSFVDSVDWERSFVSINAQSSLHHCELRITCGSNLIVRISRAFLRLSSMDTGGLWKRWTFCSVQVSNNFPLFWYRCIERSVWTGCKPQLGGHYDQQLGKKGTGARAAENSVQYMSCIAEWMIHWLD